MVQKQQVICLLWSKNRYCFSLNDSSCARPNEQWTRSWKPSKPGDHRCTTERRRSPMRVVSPKNPKTMGFPTLEEELNDRSLNEWCYEKTEVRRPHMRIGYVTRRMRLAIWRIRIVLLTDRMSQQLTLTLLYWGLSYLPPSYLTVPWILASRPPAQLPVPSSVVDAQWNHCSQE